MYGFIEVGDNRASLTSIIVAFIEGYLKIIVIKMFYRCTYNANVGNTFFFIQAY